MAYVPLHVHSEYSLLDGAIRLADLARRCRELGLPACALTDHGNLHGAVEFHDACLSQGIRPVLGCELYVAPGSRFDRQGRGPGDAGRHLVVLARNDEGWRNLMALSSKAHLEGFHTKPRVDKALLAEHARGLTCLSGCLSGEVASLLLRGEEPLARAAAASYLEVFGRGRFYLEIQDHGLSDQARVNAGLAALSRDLDVPLVATPDCHYLDQGDARAHAVLLCIQTATTVNDPQCLRFESDEFYLKSEAQMRALFAWAPGAIDMSAEIAASCLVGFPKAVLSLPDFDLPPGVGDPLEYLRALCLKALPDRYPGDASAARVRLEHELGVIGRLGYAGYFLIVGDFVAAARARGVRVGPGRGSAGASVVSYLLGVTAIDPLAKGLLFERFLNPERVSPPDIDVDFADTGREKVIDYVVQKYGRPRVAQIIAFGRLGARAAVRDVGRALDYPYAEVDAMARLVPAEPDMSLEKALQQSPDLAAAAQSERGTRLLSTARSLEGLARHASTHAAGVVIGRGPLEREVPLCGGGASDGGVVTQFDMASLERVGLVKMDFLGLRTLSILDDACRLVQERGSACPDLDALPDRDPKVFAMLGRGDSHGVFQLESWGMRDLLKRFKPRDREDLDQLIALFRPGPMRMIDEYLKRREGSLPVRYDLPVLEPVLKDTYGVIVYQEQVMRIAMDVAGFTAGSADILRRAMGKKDPDLIEKQRRAFVDGCAKGGVPAAKAEPLFGLLARFAEYGFNKAHSAAYALLAYQTAWLKSHHPDAFFAALLNSDLGSPERVRMGITEARCAGLTVLGPDVNASRARFSLEKSRLRFGLAAVRHVGEVAMDSLVAARGSAPFVSMQDLLERCEGTLASGKAVEHLIKAGAFDCVAVGGVQGRAALLADLPRAAERAARVREERLSGQGSLFNGDSRHDSPTAMGESWDDRRRLAFEKESLGFYLSGHPLDVWEGVLKACRCVPWASLPEGRDGAAVTVGGWVLDVKEQTTKRGEVFARLSVEDLAGSGEVILWPKVLEGARALARKDARILVRGRLDLSGEEARVSADGILALDAATASANELHVQLRPGPASGEGLLAWAKARPGSCALCLHLQDGRRGVVQRASIKVAVDAAGLAALDGLGLDAWLEGFL